MPSVALPRATMDRLTKLRPCSSRVPSVLTMYLEILCADKFTFEYSTSGESATSADHFRTRFTHSLSTFATGGGGSW